MKKDPVLTITDENNNAGGEIEIKSEEGLYVVEKDLKEGGRVWIGFRAETVEYRARRRGVTVDRFVADATVALLTDL